MNRRPALDVSRLPAISGGHQATIWWGVVGLLTIEGTMFALLIATYFYLRFVGVSWPPLGTASPNLAPGIANIVVLVLTVLPMAVAERASRRASRRPIPIGLGICIVAGFGTLALRGLEFVALNVRWDTNAYGSIVWTILGVHTAHLITSTLENILLFLLFVRGPIELKHFVDVTVNALYWYFVIAVWLPLWAVVYLAPRLS